jgi:carboxyl-terminal processing protease
VMARFHDGEVLHGDTSGKHAGVAYKTRNGHIVYGGGGITPDVFIAFDTSTINKNITALYISSTLNRFIYSYYIQNLATFRDYKNATNFNTGFHEEDKLWNSLVNYAAKDTINIRNIPQRDKQILLQRLKAMLARQIWRLEGYFEVANKNDTVVKKALDLINK